MARSGNWSNSGELRQQLAAAIEGKVVVIGTGNPCRGDDAAGSRVAQLVREAPGVCVIDAQEVPENHLAQVAGLRPDTIVLIDAVDMDSAPGSVALLDKQQIAGYWPSTHRVPLSLLADYLERATAARVVLLGIQPRETAFLEPLSAEVAASVEAVADELNEVLKTRSVPSGAELRGLSKGTVPV